MTTRSRPLVSKLVYSRISGKGWLSEISAVRFVASQISARRSSAALFCSSLFSSRCSACFDSACVSNTSFLLSYSIHAPPQLRGSPFEIVRLLRLLLSSRFSSTLLLGLTMALWTLLALFPLLVAAGDRAFTVRNDCTFTIWPAIANYPVNGSTLYEGTRGWEAAGGSEQQITM